MTPIIYLHGFASGPMSRKAKFLQARLEEAGRSVEVPDLAQGDFENLTVTRQYRFMERVIQGRAVTLIGSSLGGYLAALYAARHQEVERLVLLAPAFGFADRWQALVGEDGLRQWKSAGKLSFFHFAEQRQMDLGIAMYHDSFLWESNPTFSQPALIFHGRSDDVVPIQGSERFVAHHSNAQLIPLDSDHELLNVLPGIWGKSGTFLAV